MVKYSEMAVSVHLPRSWATGAVCPVCGDNQLSIDRLVDSPDVMVCACCTTAYEVATDGYHIHPVRVPGILPEKVKEIWYRPGELRELAAQASLARQKEKAASLQVDALDVEELRRRALGLRKLGNSTERIRVTLSGLPGVKAEDVRVLLQELEVNQDQREYKVLRRATFLVGGLILIIALVVFFTSQGVVRAAILNGVQTGSNPIEILASLFLPRVPAAETQATQESQFLDTALLPPVLQTAVPQGMKVLKPPPVIVLPGQRTGKISRCPASTGDAVRVFGGDMKIWSKSRGGWTMISTSPESLFIPEGMTGGYLIYISKPEFNSVSGPATIENVNFLAISCE